MNLALHTHARTLIVAAFVLAAVIIPPLLALSNTTAEPAATESTDAAQCTGAAASEPRCKCPQGEEPLDPYTKEAQEYKDKYGEECFNWRVELWKQKMMGNDPNSTDDAQGLQDIGSENCTQGGTCSQPTEGGQAGGESGGGGGSSGGGSGGGEAGGIPPLPTQKPEPEEETDPLAERGYLNGEAPSAYAPEDVPLPEQNTDKQPLPLPERNPNNIPPLPEQKPETEPNLAEANPDTGFNPPPPTQNEWKEEPQIPELWPEVRERLIRMTHAEKCSSTTNVDHCTAFAGTPIKRALYDLQRKGIPVTEESFNKELMSELRWTDQGGYYQSDSRNKNRFSGLSEGSSAWNRAATAVDNALAGNDPTNGMFHNYYFSNRQGIDTIAEADAFFRRTTGYYGHGVAEGTFVKVPGGYELYYTKDHKRAAAEPSLALNNYSRPPQAVTVAAVPPTPSASPFRPTSQFASLGVQTPTSQSYTRGISGLGSQIGAQARVVAESFLPTTFLPSRQLTATEYTNPTYDSVRWTPTDPNDLAFTFGANLALLFED